MATPRKSAKRSASKKGGSQSKKAGLVFPVGRVGSLLRRGQYARRVGASAATYLCAVVEYLTAELLELTSKAAAAGGNKKKAVTRLTPRLITLAVRHDEDLGSLLQNVTLSRGGVLPTAQKAQKKSAKK